MHFRLFEISVTPKVKIYHTHIVILDIRNYSKLLQKRLFIYKFTFINIINRALRDNSLLTILQKQYYNICRN